MEASNMKQHHPGQEPRHPAPAPGRRTKETERESRERAQASQRRGQWTRLVRKIDELRFRASIERREQTEAEARDIRNCEA